MFDNIPLQRYVCKVSEPKSAPVDGDPDTPVDLDPGTPVDGDPGSQVDLDPGTPVDGDPGTPPNVEAGRTLDVGAVRALTHPLRLRLLDLLRFEGPSTATLLAGQVGESSGSTSYHLRQLARHGFIEEATHRGGRERWWRYQERRDAVTEEDVDTGSVRTLLGQLLSREAYALDGFLAAEARDPAWDSAAFFQSSALRLTVDELQELQSVIGATLAGFRAADRDDAPPEAVPVRVLAFAFPQALGES